MGFASDYLLKRQLFPVLFSEAPESDTGIIVVIPAYNEPDITATLDSLNYCDEPECKTEVLIIVNAPAGAPADILRNNKLTIDTLQSWKEQNKDSFFRLYFFNTGESDNPDWGVGMARKTGMDEASGRFDLIDRPDGVIASLDADCRVAKNYFTCLYNELLNKRERKGCSLYFEHPLSGALPHKQYKSIVLYELHMRYYFQALKYTGFPYVHHTVGSAIAIKASQYVKAGGMNRKQAGEDFYFVQKLVPAGGYFNLTETTIYPSARVSERVPFGTGPVVGKLSEMDEPGLETYNLDAFKELRELFFATDNLFTGSSDDRTRIFYSLPEGLRTFIGEEEWNSKLLEIRLNTANSDSFKKRFYNWFNMFRVVKYLNFVHGSFFKKNDVVYEAYRLAHLLSYKGEADDPYTLLLFYRQLEKPV